METAQGRERPECVRRGTAFIASIEMHKPRRLITGEKLLSNEKRNIELN